MFFESLFEGSFRFADVEPNWLHGHGMSVGIPHHICPNVFVRLLVIAFNLKYIHS